MSFLSKIYKWRRATTAHKLQNKYAVMDDQANMLVQQAINHVRKSSDARWSTQDQLLVELNIRAMRSVMVSLPLVAGVQPLQAPLGICYAIDRIRDGNKVTLTANSYAVSTTITPLSVDLSESALATVKIGSTTYKNMLNVAVPQIAADICSGVVATMFNSVGVIETEDGSPTGIRRAIDLGSRSIGSQTAPANAIIVTSTKTADAIIEAYEDEFHPSLYDSGPIRSIGTIGGKMALIVAGCDADETRAGQALVTHINGATDAGCIYAPHVLVTKDPARSAPGHLALGSNATTIVRDATKYYYKIDLFK